MRSDERNVDSVGASPVSVSGMSTFSDVESVFSLEDNNKRISIISNTTMNDMEFPPAPVVSVARPETPKLPVHPDFAYEDGNIELQTSANIFWIHEFQLKKFSVLAERIDEARKKGTTSSAGRLQIRTSRSSHNFSGAFRVLYACVFSGFEGVPKFDSDTLTCALRIGTRYGCPDMRNFAIAQLESRFQSPSILRIKLSDELNITTWAKPAFIELCRRTEPITQDEAKVLGAERLAEVSRIREAEQRRKLIQLVNKSVGSHGLLDGARPDDKLRDDAKCTLRYSSLPKCDCRVQTVCDDTQLDSRSINPNTLPVNNRHSIAGPFGLGSLYTQPKGLKDSGYSVVPCQIHKIAPRVVSESLALFEQRNDLVKRLEELKMVVSNTAPQVGGKESSVEDEINRATWLRKFT